MLTKRKWCRDWEEYSVLLQESLREGEFFNKEEKLAEVKERLERYHYEICMQLQAQAMDVIRGNRSRAAVIRKAECLDGLANKYNAGEVVLKEDYEKAYPGLLCRVNIAELVLMVSLTPIAALAIKYLFGW